ncbi:unnamed protein product [Darwinula stevensoni]|uniref:Sushi/von Willebrand factor type A/EGF/pentraxin domain-containing 1 n=1 Tax=Darwinula stevensoni TaxID=69355 RepID=A0A7R8XHV5_9CRUS|nr:unnamed protein product [Darwinula stevensoni]CAG0893228.1 unnamed protein product [Darwinula stevensoni]
MGDLNGAGTPTKDIHGASGLRCGFPGQPANGWIINDATFYFYRDLATYQCADGFVLYGPRQRMCLENGTWSGTLPACGASGLRCGSPGQPTNGWIINNASSYFYRDLARYRCADGFVLFGPRQRMCLENGTWSGRLPTCEFNLARGKVSEQSLTPSNYLSDLAVDGDPGTCSCALRDTYSWWQVNLGRRYNIASIDIRIQRGTYQAFTVFLIDVREEKLALYEECARFSGTFPNDNKMFRCKEGLGTPGQIVYIRDDRQTQASLWLCEVQVFASRVPSKPNNLRMVDRTPTTIALKWDRPDHAINSIIGYELYWNVAYSTEVNRRSIPVVEEYLLTSLHPNKQHFIWLAAKSMEGEGASTPALQVSTQEFDRVPCGDPEQPIYSSVNRTENQAHYSCLPGFILKGETVRNCLAEGQWSSSPPTCVEQECEAPVQIENGFFLFPDFKGRYVFGLRAIYECNPGFLLWGNATRTCSPLGVWSGSVPQCKKVQCPAPPSFANAGLILPNGSEWKAVAVYRCDPGFILPDGGRELRARCIDSGEWESVVVDCMNETREDRGWSLETEVPRTNEEHEGAKEREGNVTGGLTEASKVEVIVGITAMTVVLCLILAIMGYLFLKRRRSRGDVKKSVLNPRSTPRCPCIEARDHFYDEVYTPSTRSHLSSAAGAGQTPATGDDDSLEPISIYHPMDSSISDGSSSVNDNPSLIYDVPGKGQSDQEHRYQNLPVLKPLHTSKDITMPDIMVSTNVPPDILALYAKVNKSKMTKTKGSEAPNDPPRSSSPSYYNPIPAHSRPNSDYETLDEANQKQEEGVIYDEIDVPTRETDRQQSHEEQDGRAHSNSGPPFV